jgi:16S rRNA (uracil1498-N3)-methyltransferase
MHRFYLPPEQCTGPALFLTGREAHHARHVLRLCRGDAVVVLDGAGKEFACAVEDSDRDKVKLSVVEMRAKPPLSCRITLLQAIPKGKIIETIIQKATELGASRIVPLLSERVAVRLDAREAAQKAAKLQLVAIEAIKQCGAAWLPKVETPVSLAGFLARREEFELPLVASLQAGSRSPKEYFQAFRGRHSRSPASACVWVGPEGDFTAAEISAVEADGALPITLGPLVLRAETAATYCLSVLNYECLQAPSAA